MIKPLLLAGLGLTLASCGIYGVKGNDTGGVIPWSPEAEASASYTAHSMCSWYGKGARITSVRRVYGDYIVYQCQFDDHRRRFGPG